MSKVSIVGRGGVSQSETSAGIVFAPLHESEEGGDMNQKKGERGTGRGKAQFRAGCGLYSRGRGVPPNYEKETDRRRNKQMKK